MWVDDIREGMRLGAAAMNERGQTLLPRGTVLTTAHVRLLRAWGLSDVEIEGEASRPERPEERVERERIQALFHEHAEDPVLGQLREWALSRLERKRATASTEAPWPR